MNKIVTFGDVMLRLSTPFNQRFSQMTSLEATYGGVEVNVAVALSNMGVPSSHITRFPDNDIGKAAESHFIKHGIDTSSFLWGGDRIGLYYLEHGIGARAGKVVYDRMGSSFCTITPEMIDWENVLEGATWFHFSGITPALSHGVAEACMEAVKLCKKKGITVSSDVNYRKNLWLYGKPASEIMSELLGYTDIAIASAFDMSEQFGIEMKGKTSVECFENSTKEFVKLFPNLKKIVTTYREVPNASENHIRSFMFEKGEVVVSKKIIVDNIVDRIGTGDAFAAGLIYSLMQNWTNAYSLEFGMASMFLKHYISGDQLMAKVDEIKYLADGNELGRLIR